MDRLIPAVAILAVVILGRFRILNQIQKIDKQLEFVTIFRGKLMQFIKSSGEDAQAYQWLVSQMDKMQADVGIFGINDYRPPFSNYIVRNFELLINLIPAIGSEFDTGGDPATETHIRMIFDCLTRYQGQLLRNRDSAINYLRNPINWFRDGLQMILNLPATILYWFGVLGVDLYHALIGNKAVKFIGSVVSLIAFFSALVSIVAGWDAFLSFIQRILIAIKPQ